MNGRSVNGLANGGHGTNGTNGANGIHVPDVIVAIDLGMTYTGVGWARPLAGGTAMQSPIQIVHDWPGSLSLNEQKVKTGLSYAPSGALTSWGNLCDEDRTPDRIHKEFFKIFIDQATVDRARSEGLTGAPASTGEAQKLIADYLRQVYLHIQSTLAHQMGVQQWADLAIDFVFSVPTTWRTHDVINAFKSTIRAAGFGVDGPRHQAAVELTESEAAAVATIKSATVQFQKGDIFVVVDAGGGTTDCAVMQVLDGGLPFPRLAQVTEVDGVGIGSTLIDVAFAAIMRDRIAPFPDLQDCLPQNCVEAVVRGDAFKRMKHRFGEPTFMVDVYDLPLDGVGYNFHYPPAGIQAGKMLFSREDIQALFDPHIERILEKVREQLDWAERNLVGATTNYMVLSGGLGSSKYVRDRLEQSLHIKPHPAAPAIRILQAPDPQLVIVKGLLLDRLQKIDSGLNPVLVQRRARSSYGVISEKLFDPILHTGSAVKKDPYDGKLYAVGQISWIIVKGDPVDPDKPIGRNYYRYFDPTAGVMPAWDSHIVQYHGPRDTLPTHASQEGVLNLCKVTSNLSGITQSDLQQRRRASRWFRRGEKYFVCQYQVRAIIDPADLRFELWFGGKKFSGNHEPIQVEWEL